MLLKAAGAVALLILSVAAVEAKEPQWLLIQEASSARLDGQVLTLIDAEPETIAFTERPDRLVRHIDRDTYLKMWDAGIDGFAADPPNAGISSATAAGVVDAVVELRNPRVEAGNLLYDIVIVSGTVPPDATSVSVFIDSCPTSVNPLITD